MTTPDDGLTAAGRHLREIAASGSESVRPWGFVPCAREHEPDRVCIQPDGHPPAPDVDGLREAVADALGALPEAHNVTDYTDEQTTMLTMDVEGIADAVLAVVRPLLDDLTAKVAAERYLADTRTLERNEARERVEYVTQLNTEKARHVRGLEARLAEVAAVAEQRGEKVAALTEQIDRVKALADDMDKRGAVSENDSHLDAQSRRQIREDAARLRAALRVTEA